MVEALVYGERRGALRKECYVLVTLDDFKSAYPARLHNLSLGGAFIETPADHTPKLGQEIVLTIPFQLKKDRVLLRGRIGRVRPNGVGVVFLKEAQ